MSYVNSRTGEVKIVFHKSYLDRIPKRNFPVFDGSFSFVDFVIPVVVVRNMQASKYFWRFEFLSRSFVFWTESYGSNFMSKFHELLSMRVDSFLNELKCNDSKCNVLIQNPSQLLPMF